MVLSTMDYYFTDQRLSRLLANAAAKYPLSTRPLDGGDFVNFDIDIEWIYTFLTKFPSWTSWILTATFCNLEDVHNNGFCCRKYVLTNRTQMNNLIRPVYERRQYGCSLVTNLLLADVSYQQNAWTIPQQSTESVSRPRNGETNYSIM